MKKLHIALLLATLAACASGASAQFRYGPALGMNVSTMNFKQDLVTVEQTFNPQAGLQCEYIFTGIGIGIDFGLFYNMTGARVNLGLKPIWASEGYGNERVDIHNLMIPLHLRFKWTKMQGFEEYLAPFIYGGPDFNIQVGHSRLANEGRKAFKYSGGDVNLTCGFGLEIFRNWQASFGYTWGVTYALKTRALENFSARTQGWNVRVAYLF